MTSRLLLLTSHPQLHGPRRMAEAGRALGFDVELLRPADLREPLERAAGAWLLARPGTFSLHATLRSWRALVAAGATPLQPRHALLTACDQWQTLQSARRAGVRTPPTRLVRRPSEIGPALDALGGTTWYVKGRRGSQGTHVLRADDRRTAIDACLRFWGSGQAVLLQSDRSALGPVERHLVSAGRIVASVRAEPREGEHRSNAHQGGRFQPLARAEATAASLALAAVAAVGLPYAAVDAIGGPEPELLEVNASPGLAAIEAATGEDLARALLSPWLARPIPSKARGAGP